mgnify:CR=1 FL=1
MFTLEAVYCLGNCAAAPSVMVDDRLYGRVTPERLDKILADGSPTTLPSADRQAVDAIFRELEAVRQLRGEAHPKVQVKNCDLALAHGTGGALGHRHGLIVVAAGYLISPEVGDGATFPEVQEFVKRGRGTPVPPSRRPAAPGRSATPTESRGTSSAASGASSGRGRSRHAAPPSAPPRAVSVP